MKRRNFFPLAAAGLLASLAGRAKAVVFPKAAHAMFGQRRILAFDSEHLPGGGVTCREVRTNGVSYETWDAQGELRRFTWRAMTHDAARRYATLVRAGQAGIDK